jgi:hypothetical protein
MSTIWSVILNRIDGLSQVWKEWRAMVVSVSSGVADAGAIPMLGPTGQLDPSMIPGSHPPLTPTVVTATVDFGFDAGNEGDVARLTIAAPWVTSQSNIFCQSVAVATIDHDPEDAALENIQVWAENLVPGVSFDVIAVAPQNSWGKYMIQAAGL